MPIITPEQFIREMKAAADRGLSEYDAEQALKIKTARYKLAPFLSYYGDLNMCDCSYKSQADAWMKVWNQLGVNGYDFLTGSNGAASAVAEIKRLQDMDALARQLEKDNLREREKYTETLKVSNSFYARCVELQKLLEQERATVSRLSERLNLNPPVMGGGYEMHERNVRNAARQYDRKHTGFGRNCPLEVAEAVQFLLQRVEKLEEQNAALSVKGQVHVPPLPQSGCGQTAAVQEGTAFNDSSSAFNNSAKRPYP